MQLRPIKPIRPGLSPRYKYDRLQWSNASNASNVEQQEYSIDAARTIDGFSSYLECWEQQSKGRKLPTLADFDGIRSMIGIAGVHLVDVSAGDQSEYRFLTFDSTTHHNQLDLSGTYVREYPHAGLRRLGLIDFDSAICRREGVLSSIEVEEGVASRKFARLVLPISDSGSNKPSKLLSIIRLNSLKQADRWHEFEADRTVGRRGARDKRRTKGDGELAQGGSPPSTGRAAKLTSHDAVLRRHFGSGREEHLDDHELLELLLRQAMPEKMARVLTSRLLQEFSTLPTVLAMGYERVSEFPGLSSKALVALKVVRELATRIVRIEVTDKPQLSEASLVIDYCRARMAHETMEHVRVLFLDQKNRLIADEAIHGGGVSAVPLNPRHIVKRAIVLDSQSIILAHNHPSGDPSPSNADVEATRFLRKAASSVGLRLLDHFIIGRSGHVSLGSLGYLDDNK